MGLLVPEWALAGSLGMSLDEFLGRQDCLEDCGRVGCEAGYRATLGSAVGSVANWPVNKGTEGYGSSLVHWQMGLIVELQ